MNAADMARLVGTYHSAELDVAYTVTAVGATLMLTRPRTPPDSLSARDARTLASAVGTLHFTLG